MDGSSKDEEGNLDEEVEGSDTQQRWGSAEEHSHGAGGEGRILVEEDDRQWPGCMDPEEAIGVPEVAGGLVVYPYSASFELVAKQLAPIYLFHAAETSVESWNTSGS